MRRIVSIWQAAFIVLAIARPAAAQPAPSPGGTPDESLAALLAIAPRQIVRLDRIYHDFADIRWTQESCVTAWENELRILGQAGNRDERQAARLELDISHAHDRIAAAARNARAEAGKALTPEQAARLAQLRESGVTVRIDKYSELLLLPIDEIVRAPFDKQTAEMLIEARMRQARKDRRPFSDTAHHSMHRRPHRHDRHDHLLYHELDHRYGWR